MTSVFRRPWSATALTATLVVGLAAPATANDHGRLQRDLDALVALGDTGAQTRTVAPDGTQRTARSGVSDISRPRPVSTRGHFRMGSTTKTFTATVVLQLVAEGTLSLEDTAEKWLPGVVQGSDNDGRTITIRHLLQHTSGIDDVDYPQPQTAEEFERTRFRPTPPERIVANAMRHRRLFEPGKGWSYANTGYVILGMIIEKATGDPWYREVENRVFKPLDLRESSWPGRSPELPRPHATAYKRFEPGGPLVDVTRTVNVDASGGLVTTTADLNTFFRALIGGRLLPKAQLKEMQHTVNTDESVQRVFPGATYGLGIMNIPLKCGGSYWSNSGSDPGWGNDNGVTEDGRRSVVTSWSTEDVTDPDNAIRQTRAFVALTNHALCDTR
ncbi:serine hydrolase domain-containing protein [Actinomadura terrae]|uniref:serine hydrolase domain-containing protein n=1 Tax=Actinomadura terrae TaxID=604353 RepID=UPI001FA791F3|nr:serine hydrolase domain-containing protein [Actinomadura terrae]